MTSKTRENKCVRSIEIRLGWNKEILRKITYIQSVGDYSYYIDSRTLSKHCIKIVFSIPSFDVSSLIGWIGKHPVFVWHHTYIQPCKKFLYESCLCYDSVQKDIFISAICSLVIASHATGCSPPMTTIGV